MVIVKTHIEVMMIFFYFRGLTSDFFLRVDERSAGSYIGRDFFFQEKSEFS